MEITANTEFIFSILQVIYLFIRKTDKNLEEERFFDCLI